MENKHIKYNINRFKIQFKNIVFRDINEFVIDLKNIFAHINQLYQTYIVDVSIEKNKETLDKLTKELNSNLKTLQKELQDKLLYITNTDLIDSSMIGKVRPKLIQLKSLTSSIDITSNYEDNIKQLTEFFTNRVLESKIAITGKIITSKNK